MEMQTPEAQYAEIRRGYRENDVVPAELTEIFAGKLKREFTRLALLPTIGSFQERIRRSLGRVIETVQEHVMFDLHIKGAEELADAELILGNHQGPSGDGKKQGGLETIFAWSLLPPGVRIVMKDELLKRTGSLKQRIGARVLRKSNPIPIHRPEERETKSSREYAAKLLEERRRVFMQIFEVINTDGSPVLLYPEGTRSPDGHILPFMRDLFDTALTKYVLPRIAENKEPKVGLLVADTLQTFPEGLGGGATAYRRPITMRGVRYDAGPLIERAKTASTPAGLKQLGKWFCEDVRSHVQRELSDILASKLDRNNY